jgi:hypothetical protein
MYIGYSINRMRQPKISLRDPNLVVRKYLGTTKFCELLQVKRLAWVGHLTRMSDDRTLKKIFSTKSDGTRSVGRPKLRWEDGVVQDMQILGVKRWKNVALNRDEWAKLLQKARVHQGLSSQ